MKEFFRFSLVGTLGFITDASILMVLIHVAHIHPIVARLFSFLVASLVTWYCNRHFTFSIQHHHKKIQEWLRYVAVNGMGAIINFLIYSVLILKSEGYFALPLVALAIASIIALGFNFMSSKYIAFTTNSTS